MGQGKTKKRGTFAAKIIVMVILSVVISNVICMVFILESSKKQITDSVKHTMVDFVNTTSKIMENDILKAIEAGAQNLVLGALTEDNQIDVEALETLMVASQGLPVTFHMAFDEIEDQHAAIDTLVEAGVEKILMHGDSLDKPLNTEKIADLVKYAKGRIAIIIGGGVTVDNYEEYANLTGTNFVHGTKIIAK